MNTISDLRAASVSQFVNNENIYVTGYYSKNDGGGGIFVYDSSSAATDNGGTVIAPASGSGRYLRIVNEPQVNVRWFGAKGDGVTDDLSAIQTAINAANTKEIILPKGTYRTSGTLSVLVSGVEMTGVGLDDTVILADLAVTPVLKIGDTATTTVVHGVKVRNLKISRASGTVPDGSVGLLWDIFNYGLEENVLVHRHAVGRHIYGGPPSSVSVGLVINNPLSSDAKTYHMKVENVASLFVNSGMTGRNGGDAFDCTGMICITGQANGIVFNAVDIIPQGPGVAKPVAVDFVDYINTAGYIVFQGCNTENSSIGIRSNAGTTLISTLCMAGGRWAPESGVFSLNAATLASSWRISAVPFATTVALTNPRWLDITGCTFGAAVTLTGGADAHAVISGCDFIGNLTLTGAWAKLTFGGCVVGGTFTDTSTGREFGVFSVIANYTVAALPAATTPGRQAYATNLASTTHGATAAGGGSGKAVVVADGTNWIVQ